MMGHCSSKFHQRSSNRFASKSYAISVSKYSQPAADIKIRSCSVQGTTNYFEDEELASREKTKLLKVSTNVPNNIISSKFDAQQKYLCNDAAQHCASTDQNPPAPRNESRTPSSIKKFESPILQLIDLTNGKISSVTIERLETLFVHTQLLLLIFGVLSTATQESFDNKEENVIKSQLQGSPYQYVSHVGYVCKKGLKPKGPNQDDFFLLQIEDLLLYGVFDGHGPCGHEISSFVQKTLPFLILSDSLFETEPEFVIRRAFSSVQNLLVTLTESSDNHIDCTLSGTTVTLLIQRHDLLYAASVGDSRAVMGIQADSHKIVAKNITFDHKPNDAVEKTRIEASGGEVRQLSGDIPYRVFAKNKLYPGLAMSRAIGDSLAATVGVSSDPDISVIKLDPTVKFIIIATDGLWEFVSSQEAVNYVSRTPKTNVQDAADFLVYESWKRWLQVEKTVVDDVTCIINWLS